MIWELLTQKDQLTQWGVRAELYPPLKAFPIILSKIFLLSPRSFSLSLALNAFKLCTYLFPTKDKIHVFVLLLPTTYGAQPRNLCTADPV